MLGLSGALRRCGLRPCASGLERAWRGAAGRAPAAGAYDWAWIWDTPGARDAEAAPQPGLGLVLLNTPLSEAPLREAWARATVRVVADGAANRLLRVCDDLVPDVLLGDFDSVEPEALLAYRERGVEIRDLAHDQDSTDLEKALCVLRERGCDKAIVAGQFAGVEGRLDHTFGIMSTLCSFSDMKIVVLGADCLMHLLEPGEHRIFVPDAESAPHCGLVPLAGPCEAGPPTPPELRRVR